MSAIGILATFIVDDLEITRTTLGWIVATNVILAAVLSPIAGRATDFAHPRQNLTRVPPDTHPPECIFPRVQTPGPGIAVKE